MQDWKVVGPVKVIYYTGRIESEFDSLEDCCRHYGKHFMSLVSELPLENFIRLFSPWGELSYQHYINRGLGYIVVDENNLTVPKAIIERVCGEVCYERHFCWYRTKYNPEKDFRNGPVHGYPFHHKSKGRRNRGRPGHYHRCFRHIQERRWAEAHEQELKEYGGQIRAKRNRNNIPDPRDDYSPTRYGNNWKRYRKHQWKEKK